MGGQFGWISGFPGWLENGKMILQRSYMNKNGQIILQRMVFFNIEKNSFDWDWENSADAGVNWKSQWKIHYKKMEKPG
jgi:hypothetical protein